MGMNIKQPVTKLLFNELAASDFGVFFNTKIGLPVLIFKGIGIEIPLPLIDITEDVGFGEGSEYYKKDCYRRGALKSVRVTFSDVCPCQECNYEYGFKVTGFVEKPGVDNDQYYPEPRFYGGKLDAVQECDAGLMDPADVLLMEDNILEQIREDDDAIVGAFRIYRFTDDDDTTESTVIITINDVATTVTAAGDHSGPADGESAFVDAINLSAAGDGVLAMRGETDATVYVISRVNGSQFTLEEGTDTTVVWRSMILFALDVNESFQVEYEDSRYIINGWNSCSFNVDDNTVLDADFGVMYQGTLESFSVAEADEDDFKDTINDEGVGLLATWDTFRSNLVYVFGDADVTDLFVQTPAGSTAILVNISTEEGRWPFLTSDDVFKVFANIPQNGKLANLTYKQQAIEGEAYCKYIFKTVGPIPSLSEGASHYNWIKTLVHVYILESQLLLDIWADKDTMAEPGDEDFDAADMTFDELLAAWWS